MNGGGDGEVGFAGTCGTEAKNEVIFADGAEVGELVGGARADGFAAYVDVEALLPLVEVFFFHGGGIDAELGRVGVGIGGVAGGSFPTFAGVGGFGGLFGDEIEDGLAAEGAVVLGGVDERLEDAAGGADGVIGSGENDAAVARQHLDAQGIAQKFEIAVRRTNDGDAVRARRDFHCDFQQASPGFARGRGIGSRERLF